MNRNFQLMVMSDCFNVAYSLDAVVNDNDWDLSLQITQQDNNRSTVNVTRGWRADIPQTLINAIAQKIIDREYQPITIIHVKIT